LSVVLLLLPVCACGGNISGGGGTPPPTSSEILYAADTSNSIFAFSIDQTTGGLNQTAAETPGGNTVGNTGMAITPSGSFLYAANNVNSEINGYATSSSGTLSLVAGSPFTVQPTSLGIGGFAIDPGGKFLYAGNQSGFGVVGFTIDNTTGALTTIPGGPFSSPGNGGPPLDLAIDPTGKFLYTSASFDDVFLPAGYNIWAFTIDSQTGALTSIPGSPFLTQGNSQPQGIRVDPSGKFLYVALSNAGSIAAFTIDGTTGVLTSVPGSPFATASTEATQTYEIALAPSGKFLYAFNFNGNTMAAFTIDSTSGVLTTIAGSPFPVIPNGEGGIIVDPSGKFLYLTIGFGPPSAFVIFNIDPNTGGLTSNPVSPVAGSQAPLGLAVAKFQ
jgi:6-phosphogluconolactonase (cycloisomerase 2 family)